MIADHDRKVNPRWPHPDDDPTARARRIASAYRSRLRAVHREAADECDELATGFGETWMLEAEDLVDDDRELTTAEAAELVNVTAKTIRNWACLDNPEQPGRKLLPRFTTRGRETIYLAGAVREAHRALLRIQHARTHS